jgi:hypothetical protein
LEALRRIDNRALGIKAVRFLSRSVYTSGKDHAMGPQARAIWDSLEFRTPAIFRAVENLSETEIG